MKRIIKNIHLNNRFFLVLAAIAILFVCSFWLSFLFILSQLLLVFLVIFLIADIIIIFSSKQAISGMRHTPKMFSLSHEHQIKIQLENLTGLKLQIELIDELPFQLQKRDFNLQFEMEGGSKKHVYYPFRAVERGEYQFGNIQCFISNVIGLVSRKESIPAETSVPVYPSIIEMKDMELKVMQRVSTFQGIKKHRRIGHSYEFEQIKNYVQGDDYRSINWKASSRKASLMVNQYEDERSQQVYAVIDKSRAMHMPFNGLSILDYAINSSLVISNIALKKHDRSGLVTFSDSIDTIIKADNKNLQIKKILEALYRETPGKEEANFEGLLKVFRQMERRRSLVLLFTNFESYYALERVLPILRRINHQHLLVVILFENSEISDYSRKQVEYISEIYTQTIARKFITEKFQMTQTLLQFGIQTMLTRPEDLSVNTVNKYIELKAKGLI
jgi:uncharacterized protein (DUF58 family)